MLCHLNDLLVNGIAYFSIFSMSSLHLNTICYLIPLYISQLLSTVPLKTSFGPILNIWANIVFEFIA